MLPVPDKYLSEARQILASFMTGEVDGELPYPDESQALSRPAEFCRAMARYVLSTMNSALLGEPERSVRRAAYYLMIAKLYGPSRAVREGLVMAHQGSWSFAMGEVAVSS